MRKRCNHNWIPLLPKREDLPSEEHQRLFHCELIYQQGMKQAFYCTECGGTGWRVKATDTRIKKHSTPFYLEEAKRLGKRYDFNIPYLKTG